MNDAVNLERGIDVARVPHVAARRIVRNHFFHIDSRLTPEEEARAEDLRARLRAGKEELETETQVKFVERFSALETELKALDAKDGELGAAHWDATAKALVPHNLDLEMFSLHDDYTGVYRCSVTGLPLMSDDKLATDPEGSDFLLAIVPVPVKEVAETESTGDADANA